MVSPLHCYSSCHKDECQLVTLACLSKRMLFPVLHVLFLSNSKAFILAG